MSEQIEICVVDGVEGESLVVNEKRVSGPKAWGGGTVTHSFNVEIERIIKAIPRVAQLEAERDKLINALRFYAPHGEWGADTGTPQKGKGEPIVFTDVDGTERKIDYAPIDAALSEQEAP